MTLDEMLADLPRERRERVERDAAAIVVESRMLRDLRRSLNVTQRELAAALGTSQANVAQIERSDDVKVSTVARVVEALGGALHMAVEMPGRPVATFRVGTGAPRARARKGRGSSSSGAPARDGAKEDGRRGTGG